MSQPRTSESRCINLIRKGVIFKQTMFVQASSRAASNNIDTNEYTCATTGFSIGNTPHTENNGDSARVMGLYHILSEYATEKSFQHNPETYCWAWVTKGLTINEILLSFLLVE